MIAEAKKLPEAKKCMDEVAEWQLDSETQLHMDQHMNYMSAEAKNLDTWLNEEPDYQPGHPLFVWWTFRRPSSHLQTTIPSLRPQKIIQQQRYYETITKQLRKTKITKTKQNKNKQTKQNNIVDPE